MGHRNLTKWFLVCTFFIVTCFCDNKDPRSELGYSKGYLSECPGSTRSAVIPRSELKYINFWVKGNGKGWKKYSYFEAKKLAKDPRLNFKKKTMMYFVGYLDSPSFPPTSALSNEYEARGFNVIVPDYNRFMTLHYYISSRLTRPMGKLIAIYLQELFKEGLNPSKVEMIGISLGCQLISFVAKNFQKITGRNISRVTALDPSGPCFRTLGPEDRLAPSDAGFVQVVHTNIDGLGMGNKMGHVDFYVNGGELQPTNMYLYPCGHLCSHAMAFFIWYSAIKNPDKFIAIKCDSIQQARDAKCYDRQPMEMNILGPKVNKSNHGIFFLSTSLNFPYYLGTKGLDPKHSVFNLYNDLNTEDNQEFHT